MKRFLAALLFVFFLTVSYSFSQEDERFEGPDHAKQRTDAFWKLHGIKPGSNASRMRLRALAERDKIKARELAARTQTAGNYGTALSSVPWKSIGPSAVLEPFEEPTPNSGRVTALAIDPTNGNVMYAGAADGGIWKTTNAGQNWVPLTDSQPSLATGAIAIDPNNPDTIYVGTGEPYPASIGTYGVGLLKSTDGGGTWTNIQGPFIPFGTGSGMDIAAIAVCPQNSNIVLVAAPFALTSGIYRSTDAGNTWVQVQQGVASAVVFDPNHPGVVFAGSSTQTNGLLLRSNDYGVTWTAIYTAPYSDRVALAIAPSDSTVYAAVEEPGIATPVLKSVDGGNTWSDITEPVQPTGDPLCLGQCDYNLVLAVSPTNSAEVFFGTVFIARSQDGGATWWLMYGSYHADQHALAFNPATNTLYVGNDGGVWSTADPDAAGDDLSFTSLNNGLTTLQFYGGISIAAGNPQLGLGGMQDNGTALYQGESQWNQVVCCDGINTAIDPANPQVMYATTQLGNVWQSTDGGNSFSAFMSGLTSGGAFLTELAMDPIDPQRLYTEHPGSDSDAIFRTVDGSSTWQPAFPYITDGASPISISVSPAADNVVWVSTYGPVYVSTNATGNNIPTWTEIPLPSSPGLVTKIAPDPHDPTVAYAALSGFIGSGSFATGHVEKLSNTGSTWTDISTTFPDIPANDIIVDPAIPGVLYVATDVGVFVTPDGGATWDSLGTGLPNSIVTGLALDAQTRTLRAATHGRGMWDLQLPLPPLFTLSPASVSFGDEVINTTSASQTITVANISSSSISVGQGTVSGPFVAGNNCLSAVTASQSCSYTLTFTPTSVGAQNGSLEITDSNSGQSQTVLLSGTGVSAPVSVIPGFTLSAAAGSSTSQTVTAGQTATYTLMAAATGGFSGNVALTCTGAPVTTSCSTVQSLTLTSSGSSTFNATVKTTPPSTASANDASRKLALGLFLFGFAFTVVVGTGSPTRHNSRMLPLCVLTLAVLVLASCGGSPSTTQSTQTQTVIPGTASGTYQLTLTGSSSDASSVLKLTLTVK